MPIFSPEALQAAILNTPPVVQQPADNSVGAAPYLALVAGQGADALSTAYNYSRGYREANPLYGRDPSLMRIMATKAGLTGGLGVLMQQLAAHGHPTAAKAIGYIGAAGGAIPAAINLSQK